MVLSEFGFMIQMKSHILQEILYVTAPGASLGDDNVRYIRRHNYYYYYYFPFHFLGIRNNERSLLRKGGFFQALCQAQTTLIPILSTILTICLHTLLGNNITASQVSNYDLGLNID